MKLLTGQTYSLDISANRTIWDFKIQISQKSGVSPYQQKLACQNQSHIDLRDGAQLSEYGLKSGDVIVLVVTNEESLTVFLKTDNGRTSTYYVLPSKPVTQFRAEIQQKENIQAGQFYLTYEGAQLEDGRKLSDYKIAPNGTIYLHLRLRGGAAAWWMTQ